VSASEPALDGNRRVFAANVTGLAAATPYTFVAEFFDGGGRLLGVSAGSGCGFTTGIERHVFLCVASRRLTDATATISAITTHPAAVAAHFQLSGAGAARPDLTAAVRGANRAFETVAEGLTVGEEYSVTITFVDANGGWLGSSAQGDCRF
jgi:hypothetical protein